MKLRYTFTKNSFYLSYYMHLRRELCLPLTPRVWNHSREMPEAYSWDLMVWPYLWHRDSWAHRAATTHRFNCQKVTRYNSLFGHVARFGKDTPAALQTISTYVLYILITLGNVPRSPKKQVAGSDSLWQQPPTCWSVEMCCLTRLFWVMQQTQLTT